MTHYPNFSTLHLKKIHFNSSLTTSQHGSVQRPCYNHSFIYRDIFCSYRKFSVARHTFHFSPRLILSFILCTTSLSHHLSPATSDPMYLKQSSSFPMRPVSATRIRDPYPRPTFTFLQHGHLITLLLPTFIIAL